jgi:hypothetical protein
LPLRNNIRQPIANDLPSRRADNISDEKYAHGLFRTAKHKMERDRLAVGS